MSDQKDKILLQEGGAGGSMAHPFSLPQINTGKDLIEFFETAGKFVLRNPDKVSASDSSGIKFDGVNASIKLVDGPGGKEFALDRGSLSELDIEGVTTEKLPKRFSEGHGMIPAGKIMLDIFNQSIGKIEPELNALGLWNDSTKFFNAEFVWTKTNVVKYPEDFIAIHGVNQFYEKTHSRTGVYRPGLIRPNGEDGKPIKDKATEVDYDEKAMEDLKGKVLPIAQKFGFNLYTVVPTRGREGIKEVDYEPVLNTDLTVHFEEKTLTKNLGEWLRDKNTINPRTKMVTLSDGRKTTAISKYIYQSILGGAPLSELLASPEDGEAAINGAIFYYATELLGSALLDSLTSPLGDLTGGETTHEGIVLRNKKLFGPRPVKITGQFITSGAESPFREKPEQVDPKPLQEDEEVEQLRHNNPDIGRKIAVFPGKFKPPQIGHLESVKEMINKGVDQVLVLISPISKKTEILGHEIGVMESKKLWALYLEAENIGQYVTLITSPFNSPVQTSYEILNGGVPAFVPRPGDLIIPVASDKPDPKSNRPDWERFSRFKDFKPEIEGVIPADIEEWYISSKGDVAGSFSATDFRKALDHGHDLSRYIPPSVTQAQVRMALGYESVHDPESPSVVLGDRTAMPTMQPPLQEIFSLVEEVLNEGDWQPIAKKRTSKGHKKLLDKGRKDLTKHGKPFDQARPVDKSNAFLAKESDTRDTYGSEVVDRNKKSIKKGIKDLLDEEEIDESFAKAIWPAETSLMSAYLKSKKKKKKVDKKIKEPQKEKDEEIDEVSSMAGGGVEGSPTNFEEEDNEETT